jgi:signal recognition particle subunit SRP54
MLDGLTAKLGGALGLFKGQRELTDTNIEEGLTAVRQALLEADVHFKVARDFVDSVRTRALGAGRIQDKSVSASDQFVHAVHRELVELMGPEDAKLVFASNGPTVILMAGLQGAGKTTTCAKLAKHLVTKLGKRPLLVAADIKRPAAVEQLRVLGRQLDLPVYHEDGLEPPVLCERGLKEAIRTGRDVVILDTAGRLHVDDELMEELAAIAKRTKPHNQVLVVDAMTGQDAVRSAESFHQELALTGVILTKLDGDARGGAALSLKAVTGRPILFAGVGEKIDDLDAFSAERMAGRILGMGDIVGLVETASEKIDERDAQAQFEKMVMGTFTIEDMLAQLRMIQNLGPMKKVLGMMPGMGDALKNVDMDDKHIKRIEALCTSMTVKERLQPDLLDMSRRRRIARGAGQDVADVNALLKSYKGMKQMMKQMNKMGLGAAMGGKAKRQALAGMSPTGELSGDFGGPGLMSRLGGAAKGLGGAAKGLGSLVGLGGGGGLPEGFDPSMLAGGGAAGTGGARRQQPARDKSKEKAKRKQKQKNRKKR